jgi:hypothetical protein
MSSLKWKFFAEVFVNLIQPIPFVTVWGFGHKLAVLTVFLRLYLFARVAQDYSGVYRKRHDILDAGGADFDRSVRNRIKLSTVVKTYFYTHTAELVFGAFLLLLMPMSYIMVR